MNELSAIDSANASNLICVMSWALRGSCFQFSPDWKMSRIYPKYLCYQATDKLTILGSGWQLH